MPCPICLVRTLVLGVLLSSSVGIPVAQAVRVDGTSGNDVLEGTDRDDVIFGYAGNDRLYGYAGNDQLEGGMGHDWLYGGSGTDVLIGGEGRDGLSYFRSNAGVTVNLATDAASGGYAQGDTFTGISSVYGSKHADRLTGDGGDNRLFGAAGDDRLEGGDGNDVLIGGAGADVLDGGARVDGLSYRRSNAGVTVNLSTREASGGHAEGDVFTGMENIEGSAHADRLTGDDGDNTLEGGGGDDDLVGKAGDDTFVFDLANGHDVIADFTDRMDTIDLSAFDLANGYETVEALATGQSHRVAFFPAASDSLGRQGFARVINRSDDAGTVWIDALDDTGVRYGPLTLAIGANETAHFNSTDLEQGNPGKGIDGATGEGEGQWRLELASALDIEVLSYVRTEEGFLTSMHDLASQNRVVTFNPGMNINQMSRLRLINSGDEDAEVRIEGLDDRGHSPGSAVMLSLASRASRTLSAAELETGEAEGLSGSLGTGTGKWRLLVSSEQPLWVMSLLSSPTGHLTNLSSAPTHTEPGDGDANVHRIPLFPAAMRWERGGVQGFARITNLSSEAGMVTIEAVDDGGVAHGPLTLDIAAGHTVHFNSQDLETGDPAKGLSGGVGAGVGIGDWRLRLSSRLSLEVLAYIRTQDGFLTSMHDVVPETASGHRVAVFNPGRNVNQVSRLRLINAGVQTAAVRIEGIDDEGRSSGSTVQFSVEPRAARTLTSQQLESGGVEGVSGALGIGLGKWQLAATSDQPIELMNLLSSPTGHLTNLSSTGARDVSGVPMGGVRIDLSEHGGGTILLRNFDIADLDASDFVFHETKSRKAPALPSVGTFEPEDLD